MAANEKQLAKRKLQWKKATKKYVKKNAEKIKKLDRERKNKKYAEDPVFRSEIKERSRLNYKLKKFQKKLDEDAE